MRTLTAMSRLPRSREQLVLGPIVRLLDGDEEVLAWAHANVPDVRAPGILVVTNHNCRLHVASSAIPDISTPLAQLSGFKLDRRNPEVVRVRLEGDDHEVDVELSLTNRVRSRSVGRVLSALTRMKLAAPESFDPALTSPLPPMDRSIRHHARRVWITVFGVLVLLVSAAFATPFVPGPGALTAVAGIAILAREYEWARDLHVWATRQADRLVTSLRGLRARGRASARRPERVPRRPTGRPLEATVALPGHRGDQNETDSDPLAS